MVNTNALSKPPGVVRLPRMVRFTAAAVAATQIIVGFCDHAKSALLANLNAPKPPEKPRPTPCALTDLVAPAIVRDLFQAKSKP